MRFLPLVINISIDELIQMVERMQANGESQTLIFDADRSGYLPTPAALEELYAARAAGVTTVRAN